MNAESRFPYNDFEAKADNQSAQVIQIDKSSAQLALVALIFACIAFGAVLIGVISMPALMDAKIRAEHAQINATANTAREHARVALDKVEQTQVQLGAKGLVTPSTH